MRTLILLPLVLAACSALSDSPMNDQGTLALCFGADDPSLDIDYTGDGPSVVFDIQGALEVPDADINWTIVTCADSEPVVMQINDGTTRWWIGIDARDADGLALFDGLDAAVGDTVSADFLVDMGWYMDNALSVRDAQGTLLAAEEGYGASLVAQQIGVDSLSIEPGEPYGRAVAGDCGRRQAVTLDVNGTQINVADSLLIDGLTVHNVHSWAFRGQPDCLDIWGPTAWMAQR